MTVTACSCNGRPIQPQSRIRPIVFSSPGTWAYQLQALDLDALAKSSFDVVVVDYAQKGKPLTVAQVETLKRRPDGGARVVLAYMSIGEAESYRFYWKSSWKQHPPPFLAVENSEWKDNFKVRYWDPAWQQIILGTGSGYLDRIIDAGFDGAYLDIVDAFEYFGPGGERSERKSAAKDMAAFVIAIGRHARQVRHKSKFLIVPQNGANILDEIDSAQQSLYMKTVDAIGAEDTFFFGKRTEDNPLHPQRETIAALQKFRAAGKPVLAVDYLTDPAKAKQFVALARKHGFVPYVGRRALDRLVTQPRITP